MVIHTYLHFHMSVSIIGSNGRTLATWSIPGPAPKAADEWDPKYMSLTNEEMIECYKKDLSAQKSASAVTSVGKGDTLESYLDDIKGGIRILLSNEKVLTAIGCMLTQTWEGHGDLVKATIYDGLKKIDRLDLLNRFALYNLVGKPAWVCAGMSAPPAMPAQPEAPAYSYVAPVHTHEAAQPATQPAFTNTRSADIGIGPMYIFPDNGATVKKFHERSRGNIANVFYDPKVDTVAGLHHDIRHVVAEMATSFKRGIRLTLLIECPGDSEAAFTDTILDATRAYPHMRPYISLYKVVPGAVFPDRKGLLRVWPIHFASHSVAVSYANEAVMRLTDLTGEADDANVLAVAKRDIATMVRHWNDGKRAGNLFRVKNDRQIELVCHIVNELTAECADMRSHVEFCTY